MPPSLVIKFNISLNGLKYEGHYKVLRELMRDFIERQRKAREYDEFLRCKVELGRASMRADLGQSNDEVETQFTARRVRAMKHNKQK